MRKISDHSLLKNKKAFFHINIPISVPELYSFKGKGKIKFYFFSQMLEMSKK